MIAALTDAPGAAPALAVTDALWTAADGQVSGTQDRSGLFRAQTPQGFHYAAIRQAHEDHVGPAADDVEVARRAGLDVTIVAGDERNVKITGPEDFARAEQYLRGRMDIRTGLGYDVHAFEDGEACILCGVTVPHTKKLKGHSDADVGMHALTDAIYGERPKIGPHAGAMQAALAEIMGVAPDRVSVKATTSEQLGFTGREEGIAAQAIATLVKGLAS